MPGVKRALQFAELTKRHQLKDTHQQEEGQRGREQGGSAAMRRGMLLSAGAQADDRHSSEWKNKRDGLSSKEKQGEARRSKEKQGAARSSKEQQGEARRSKEKQGAARRMKAKGDGGRRWRSDLMSKLQLSLVMLDLPAVDQPLRIVVKAYRKTCHP
eukprot:763403-Hanusia_phi.AAC.12